MAANERAVALLRGINVGGNRKVPMARLREVFEAAGGTGVATYIQSGNVVFQPPGPLAEFGPALEAQIEAEFGFRVLVVFRTATELAAVVRDNPFPQATGDRDLHVVFLLEPPAAGYDAAIDRDVFLPEAYEVRGRDVYLYLPAGVGRSKLAEALAKLPGTATMRNWRTVTTLEAMARQ
ncbi:MAG: DUF1697 domain-containing protein [Dehalococcoidia bacterium]|nr:DUF1697 domain-containing protein [Dehalococcoidia bacterium]